MIVATVVITLVALALIYLFVIKGRTGHKGLNVESASS